MVALRYAIVAFAAATVLASPPARAQARDPVAAEALFLDARKDMEHGNYARACPKLEESQRLDPAPGTLLNLADCEEKTGQLASAWQHLRALADQIPASDERRAVIQQRAAAMDKRVPRVVIVSPVHPPRGMRITRDGVELGLAATGIPIPANPGEHVVLVTAPGRADKRITFTLSEGITKTVNAELGPAERREGGDPVEPERPSSPAAKRTVGFIVGGLAVVALGVGTAFGLAALSKKDESEEACPNVGVPCGDRAAAERAFASAKDNAQLSDIFLGTGVLMVGVAAFLVITAKDEPAAAVSRAERALSVTW
jgi:tetratricopeptide (TPR) repeat protein